MRETDKFLFNSNTYDKQPSPFYYYLKMYDAFISFNRGMLYSQKQIGTVLYFYYDTY